jgi:hypothetical protein
MPSYTCSILLRICLSFSSWRTRKLRNDDILYTTTDIETTAIISIDSCGNTCQFYSLPFSSEEGEGVECEHTAHSALEGTLQGV